MPRALLLLILALAVGAAAFVLLREGPQAEIDTLGGREPGSPEDPGADLTAPGLQGMPGTRRGPAVPPRPTEDTPPPAPPPTVAGEVVLRVLVVDEATGAPLPGALVWWEQAVEPCPRLPREEHLSPPPSPLGSRISRTVNVLAADGEGRLALDTARFGTPEEESLDVFAQAPGYVIGLECAQRLPSDVTIRLKRGLRLTGTVTDLDGKALDDAVLLARPGAATPPIPGHAGWAVSNEQGQFAVDGLLPGALRLRVGREGYFPLELEAEDPRDTRPRTYALAPAFRVRFRLRTDDGRPVVNPTVHLVWGTAPPRERLEIVQVLGDENSDGVLTQALALPATARSVHIEVKAEGYAAWIRAEEPVPPEGGERTLPVTLMRDTHQGALRIVLEDERGQRVIYGELDALPPMISALDRQDITGGVLSEIGPDLRFPALPLGRYRVSVRAFAYAPGSIEATVVGGSEIEARLRLGPPARLRVRFSAPTARIVRFQMLQEGRPIAALPERSSEERSPTAGPDGRPPLSAGETGVLLGGLASGTYEIEVLNEDLQPSRTRVTVREGATEEVEIRVQAR